ncbi:glycosyltransferase family 2 protein [Escherichia coli]|uniref:glycosyltransferase family 2 protein n=1 Tax=Escherichia coli TaxID=562 RepID=UPI001302C329|nr:glycosyltransferase family 2 protein [Escherichia coli]
MQPIKQIDIIIATCNGEKFIKEQILSLLRMEHFEKYVRKVIVCDDKSEDETISIITSLLEKDKLEIILNSENKRLGPVKNFARGIEISAAEFVMLCDQDDIWDKDKLKIYVDSANEFNRDEPILIFSDLTIVDSNLNTIAESFYKYQNLNPDKANDIRTLLLENIVPGCTMMFNRKLIEIALPLPDSCRMHDWWLLLCCCVHGKVIPINKQLSKYRQHGNNQVGAQKLKLSKEIQQVFKIFRTSRINFKKTIQQAIDFEKEHSRYMTYNNRKWINKVVSCYYNKSLLKRLSGIRGLNIRKSTFIKTVLTYCFLIMG